MAEKLGRKTLPSGKKSTAFVYRGRPAKDQGDFGADVGLADMVSVDQEGEPEGGKYYHGGVVQSGDGQWWVYLEWGKPKPGNAWSDGDTCARDFQFVRGDSEKDARDFFAKQMASKNSKRLVQKTVGGKKKWVSKGKSHGYAVRTPEPTNGLPDAYSGAAAAPAPAPAPAPALAPEPAPAPAPELTVIPFSEEMAKIVARATAGAVVRTQTIGKLVATEYPSATLIALPPSATTKRSKKPAEQTSLLLSTRLLTLPDQQIAVEDITGVSTKSNRLTITHAGGEVVIKTKLNKRDGLYVRDALQLAAARRRAATAMLRQLGAAR